MDFTLDDPIYRVNALTNSPVYRNSTVVGALYI